ncbi:MAG: hypothetical protein ABR548_05165 [Actinomycetota bacterium]
MGKRVTIYVQDSLWQEAQQRLPGLSASQLVQEGLKRLAQEHKGKSDTVWRVLSETSTGDADAAEGAGLTNVRDRLLLEARRDYESGIKAGLEIASTMTWSDLDWFRRTKNGDIDEWLQSVEAWSYGPEDHIDPDEAAHLSEILTTVERATGWSYRGHEPGGFAINARGVTFRRGVEEALGHLHESIQSALPDALEELTDRDTHAEPGAQGGE